MSDSATDNEKGTSNSNDDIQQGPVVFEHPAGVRGRYHHPLTQVCMLGFVCFMCPGLFNALNGLGAGGQVDSTTSANSNAALYATFAFTAFFAGYVNRGIHFPSCSYWESVEQIRQQQARLSAYTPAWDHWLCFVYWLLPVSRIR